MKKSKYWLIEYRFNTLQGQDVIITVTDDEVGFVPEECEKEDSVGIRNVRYRLENMVGGRLTYESALGKGTKAIIRIPGKEAIKGF